ncbi:hypothetical protein ACXN5S_19580 [Pseudoroseicyclus sp. H15]
MNYLLDILGSDEVKSALVTLFVMVLTAVTAWLGRWLSRWFSAGELVGAREILAEAMPRALAYAEKVDCGESSVITYLKRTIPEALATLKVTDDALYARAQAEKAARLPAP